MSAWQLPPAVRDLYSKHPEMHDLEAWELQSALFVLGYTDELAAEAEIAAAAEVAHVDMTGEAARLFRSSGISIYPSPHGPY